MASDLGPLAMSVHSSKEGSFEYAVAGAEGCCGKMKWNTLRQGSIWINGVFCEHESFANNRNHVAVGSLDYSKSRKTNHLEEDCGSKEVTHQGLICSESFPNCSALFKGQMDTPANEEVEILVQMDREKRRELAFVNNVNSETGASVDTCGTFSKHNVSSQAHCTGAFSTNGVSKACLQHQHLRCHASIDSGVGGTPQSICEPDVLAQDVSQKVPTACLEYSNPDVCNRSISSKETGTKDFNTSQNGKGITKKGCVCGEAENTIFSLCKEEQRGGNGLRTVDKHAVHLESNPVASWNDRVSEDEARVSGEGGMLPLIILEENRSTEATNEEELVWGSIKEEDQSVEPKNEQGSFGSCEDDSFGSIEDRTKSGSLLEEALLYALPYMSLQDILSMERVSKIFREWVRNDVLLWQQLHVEPPLSKKLTDEALFELAARSKGQLQCLSLVDCLRITEGAVEHVVCSNPRLSKLCLPGCSRVSPEGVLRMVKTHSDHRDPGMPGLKQLRLRNIYGLTKEHLDILLIMLGYGEQAHCATHKPQFYHNGHYSLSCDDQRPIDVEACPKCANVRLVFDCTRERCQERRGNIFQECRACILCIVRCEECGKCINDNDFEETFCLDLLCSSCWLRLPKCSECNRPGCGRHADHFIRTPETTFVCSDCCASPGASGPEFHVYAGFDV